MPGIRVAGPCDQEESQEEPLPPPVPEIVVQWLLVGDGERTGHLRPELILLSRKIQTPRTPWD